MSASLNAIEDKQTRQGSLSYRNAVHQVCVSFEFEKFIGMLGNKFVFEFGTLMLWWW